MMQDIGEMMGRSMQRQVDFHIWWLQSGFSGLSRTHCHKCLHPYKWEGWLRRHYQRTGHWQEEP